MHNDRHTRSVSPYHGSWPITIGVTLLAYLAAHLLALGRAPSGLANDSAEEALRGVRLLAEHRIEVITSVLGNSAETFHLYLVGAAARIFGASWAAVSVPTIVLASACVVLVMLAVRRLAPAAPPWVAVVAATSPWLFHYGQAGLRAAWAMVFAAAVALAIDRAERTGRARWWVAAGAMIGVSLYAYTACRVLPLAVAAVAAFHVYHSDDRRRLARGYALLAVAALVASVPNLVFAVAHPAEFLSRGAYVLPTDRSLIARNLLWTVLLPLHVPAPFAAISGPGHNFDGVACGLVAAVRPIDLVTAVAIARGLVLAFRRRREPLPAVLLAILLALRLRDRRRWFWFAVLALAFVMATGTRTAVGSALAAVPPFSFGRTPARALMLAVLAGTLLAAHGVADWRAGRWQRPGLALAIGVGATLALGGVGAVVALRLGPVDALPGAAPRALVAAAASVVLVAAALLVARRFPRSWPLVPAAFCVGALLALPALRVAPSGFLHVDWAGRLPPGAQDHRVHVIGARYPFPELQSVRTIRDPSPVDLPGWHDFVAEPSPPLAWWLDVGTELVPGWTGPPHLESVPRLLENTWAGRLEPGGRARWFASAATSVADDEALVRLRSGERTLFVHDAAEPQEPGAAASITDRELTPLAEVRPPALGFDVGEPAPGWLFVSEKWHPAWHAEIDGAPAAVHRANLCLMAVRVPAGRHRVVLRPESTAFRWGAIVSAAGVLVASVLLLKRPKGRADA